MFLGNCSGRLAVQESVRHPAAADDALKSMISRWPRVTAIHEGPSGRLQIALEEDVVLELVLAACATDEEAWRLLRPGHDAPHLVRCGNGTRQE